MYIVMDSSGYDYPQTWGPFISEEEADEFAEWYAGYNTAEPQLVVLYVTKPPTGWAD